MHADLLRPVLPWSGAQEEDHRFRRILLAALTLTLVLGAVLPQLPVPEVETDIAMQAAVVRLLPKPVNPLSRPESPPREATVFSPTEPPPQPPASQAAAEAVREPLPVVPAQPRAAAELPGANRRQSSAPGPVAAPEKAPGRPADEAQAARRKAAQSGVLALQDALAAMRNFTPSTASTESDGREPDTGSGPAAGGNGLLSRGLASGSSGAEVAVPDTRQIVAGPGLQRGQGSAGGLSVIRSPSSRAAGGSAVVRGNARTEEEIQAVLDRHKSAIYTIYDRELRRDSSLQGKLVVTITIAPSGKVTRCTIDYSELQSDALKTQLIRLIKGLDFGAKKDVSSVTTKVPIEFFPV